jgi:hypothetical protein
MGAHGRLRRRHGRTGKVLAQQDIESGVLDCAVQGREFAPDMVNKTMPGDCGVGMRLDISRFRILQVKSLKG